MNILKPQNWAIYCTYIVTSTIPGNPEPFTDNKFMSNVQNTYVYCKCAVIFLHICTFLPLCTVNSRIVILLDPAYFHEIF